MRDRRIRVYADTSVYGALFDAEFDKATRIFFNQVESGRFELVISSVVLDEIRGAPPQVRDTLEAFRPLSYEVDVSEEALKLLRAYMEANIIGERWRADALHVAIATTVDCRVIVSWNFRHIVHFQKIPLYNAVNLANGYGTIAIHTPQEVVRYEEETF